MGELQPSNRFIALRVVIIIGSQFNAATAEPFIISDIVAELGVGIGIAVAPDDGTDPDALLRRGDVALYRAKSDGRSSFRFFEPEMDALIEQRARLERELRAAVTANLIIPHYQPFVDLDSNRIVGFEALARWGTNRPDVFIPIAEEDGLIGILGEQILRRACLDARDWPGGSLLAVNVSALQLGDPAVGLRILSILGETGFDPRRLEIEITESALVTNSESARAVTDELRQAGVRIALDDFGTGYATLTQLLSFQFDKIKIDKSFVSNIHQGGERLVIVRAVLGLARGFGLTSIAEGVEDEQELACLREIGCQEGQGYLFGKAVPAREALALLQPTPPRIRISATTPRAIAAIGDAKSVVSTQ
jgi:predicted signal transduction protein with EAL and GGDEF domain